MSGHLSDMRPEALVMQHIVVGIDGSRSSCNALAWAVGQARSSGATVRAVHAWSPPELDADALARGLGDPRSLEVDARRELDLVVEGADTSGLAAPVERTLVRGDADRALLDAAKGADVLVIGSRGLGSGDGALGSVSHQVIAGASCPVVVVPAEQA
jgi:nucleotide-binding universal stress UspA family protein